MPSLPVTRQRTRSPGRNDAAGPAPVRIMHVAVDIGSLVRAAPEHLLGCAACAVGAAGFGLVVGVDQHQHLGADPVLGALRGQFLDQ